MAREMNPLEKPGREISRCLEPIRRGFGKMGGMAIIGGSTGPAPLKEGRKKPGSR